MSDARWIDVCNHLENNQSYVLLGYHSFEEYLEAAITEDMPVARNFDRLGNPVMVWTQLPYQWIQPNPTVATSRDGKDRSTMLRKRCEEHKKSLKILHGQNNLTTEIVKAVLHLERPNNPRIPMNLIAERLGGQFPYQCLLVIADTEQNFFGRENHIFFKNPDNIAISEDMAPSNWPSMIDRSGSIRELGELETSQCRRPWSLLRLGRAMHDKK